jgi:hypothetical protein
MTMGRTRKLPAATKDQHTETNHVATETLPPGATDFDPAQIERESEQRAASAHIANPSSTPRPSNGHAASVGRRQHKLPSTLSVKAGDMQVQLIDRGSNQDGIGIRVVFPDDRKPTEEEKAIIRAQVKGDDDKPSGFTWMGGDIGMWHKHIVRDGEHAADVPPSRPVAIRLDAESRVQKLAEALREHSADPVGYADMVKQRREQAAESSRIPD